jgi:hypothetical protein
MPWDESIGESLQRAAPYVIWVVLVLATSILVAVIRDPLSHVLREAREQLRTLRNRLLTRSAIALGRKSHRFWLARQYEPARTVAGSLDRLAQALPQVGKKSVARVAALQAELAKQLRILETLGLRPPTPLIGLTDATPTTTAARGSWWKLLVLIAIAGLTGAANSFLLNEFFQGVITADSLFPAALPDLYVSHVFAVLIFMMEVAIGFALHHFAQEHEDQSPARRLLAQAPWLVLVGLVWLEGWAYALLSYQIDIPERLNLSANSGLYTFARYFLAVFGAGLTLLLASLGYLLGDEVDKLHAGSEARRQDRLLKRYGRVSSGGADQVERTVRALTRLRSSADSFHLDLVYQFEREVDATTNSEKLWSAVYDAIAQSLESARQVDGALERRFDRIQARESRPLRTRTQVVADMAVLTAALVLLVAVTRVSVEYVAAFVSEVQGDRPAAELFALVSGVVMTGFPLLAGYVARHALSNNRYASGSRILPSSAGGRRLVRVLAVVLLVTAAAALVAMAVANRTLGPATPLNVLFGLLHAGLLALLGAGVDAALVNTLHVLQLLGLYLGRGIASVGACLLWTVRAILAILDLLVRLIAVFGQLVVRPRPPVRLGVVEIARGTGLHRELRSPARRFTDKIYAPVVRSERG